MSLMTEREASDRWCPMTRVMNANGGNRLGTRAELIDGSTCIGSKCMAWRWNEPPGPRAPDDMREPDIRGYCGAFGKVEP